MNWENDVVGGTDNNYTNGFNLKSTFEPKHVNDVFEKIPVPRISENDPKVPTKYIFGLRQDMYTPNDLRQKEIIKDENPYAGTLTIDTEKIQSTHDRRISLKVRVGTSGEPSLADRTQIFVHDTLTKLGRSQTHPAGWDNQIAAEPVLNIDYQRDREHFRVHYNPLKINRPLDFTTYTQVLGRLGNIFTDITGRIGMKTGYNLPYYNNDNEKPFTVYTYTQAFSSARLRNIYYDGGIFTDSVHTVDKEPYIVGVENGIGMGYESYSIRFVYNVQSKAYKSQNNDGHAFGMLLLGANW